jgi:hypothetical protein
MPTAHPSTHRGPRISRSRHRSATLCLTMRRLGAGFYDYRVSWTEDRDGLHLAALAAAGPQLTLGPFFLRAQASVTATPLGVTLHGCRPIECAATMVGGC